jgi:hypothetical protein
MTRAPEHDEFAWMTPPEHYSVRETITTNGDVAVVLGFRMRRVWGGVLLYPEAVHGLANALSDWIEAHADANENETRVVPVGNLGRPRRFCSDRCSKAFYAQNKRIARQIERRLGRASRLHVRARVEARFDGSALHGASCRGRGRGAHPPRRGESRPSWRGQGERAALSVPSAAGQGETENPVRVCVWSIRIIWGESRRTGPPNRTQGRPSAKTREPPSRSSRAAPSRCRPRGGSDSQHAIDGVWETPVGAQPHLRERTRIAKPSFQACEHAFEIWYHGWIGSRPVGPPL